jgi:CMP-N,N'-diacetyllegionaminic acid synthase
VDMVVSVKETDSNPYYVLFEEDRNEFLQKSKQGTFTRRQDCPKVYEYNGAVYVMSISTLKNNGIFNFNKKRKFTMSKESSVDVDDIIDFRLAEILMKERIK